MALECGGIKGNNIKLKEKKMKIKSLTKSVSIIFMLTAMLFGCCLFGNEDTGNGGGTTLSAVREITYGYQCTAV